MEQDESKTKAQLITELQQARKRIADIEAAKADLYLAEEELRKNKILLESCFDSSRDLLIISLDCEYRYLYFNKTHREVMFNVYSAKPRIGACILDIMKDKNDIKKLKAHYDRAIVGERHIAIEEYGEGQARYFYEIQYNPIYDNKYEIFGITVFAKNITKQKLAEEKLRNAEANLKNIFTISPGLICVADANTGYFTECNPAVTLILGFSVKEFESKPFMEFIHPDDKQSTVDEMTEQLRGSPVANFENRYRCKDGSYKWLAWQATAADKNGKVYAVATDITSRKRADENLLKQKHNIGERVKELSCLYGISRLVEKPDITLNKIIQGTVNLIPPSWQYPEITCARIVIDGQKFETLHFRETSWKQSSEIKTDKKQSGILEVFYMEEEPEIDEGPFLKEERNLINAIAGRLGKIIERINIEDELRTSKERLSRFMDSATDGFILLDSKLNYIDINRAALKIIGLELKDFIGMNMLDMVPKLKETGRYDEYVKVIKTGKSFYISDFTPHLKFGNKHLELKAFKVGEGLGVIFADITERKTMEQLLQHSEKMEAIGHLAGGIAHDFNNILSGIFGYAEMILIKVPKNSFTAKNIKKLLKAGERAKHMVNQILSFSRQSDEIKAAVFLGPIIKEAAQLLRASLPSSIKIVSKLAQDTKPVLADPTKIHEIIMNLCTNASYAMKDKGILEINFSDKHLKSEIEGRIGIINPGFYSVITIKDNGCGMNKEILSHIFEPLFTTKPIGHGTGMGLSVAFGIIQSHKGNLLVDSEHDVGTKFEIYLPKTDEQIIEEDDKDIIIKGGTESILFVDDEESLNDVVQNILSDLGYKVTAFTSSIKALDAFKKAPESFDLVITDQTMPIINGLELSKKLLQTRQNIPIILCSGYSKLINKDKVFKAGIKGFLKKPIRKKDLTNKIRYILDTEHQGVATS